MLTLGLQVIAAIHGEEGDQRLIIYASLYIA